MNELEEAKDRKKAEFGIFGDYYFQKFNISFALMSVLPFLGFVYLITQRGDAILNLEGQTGLVLGLLLFISLVGYLISYWVIHRLIEQLIRYANALKQIDSLKSIFVSNVSHEVKNPLGTLRLSLENLHDNLHGELTPQQRELVHTCQRTVNRLIRLSTDLLDLAKIESGKMPINEDKVVLNELIEEVTEQLVGKAKEKNLVFEKEIPKSEVRIIGDSDHMFRVLFNLLENAIKYTPKNDRFGVSLIDQPESIQIDVWNQGNPIALSERGKLFERFDRIMVDKKTGTGLGLPIVKELISLHEGHIDVNSNDSTNHFIVELPKDFRPLKRAKLEKKLVH